MPFNGSGTYSIPNTFFPNTTILSSAVNTNFSDIATALSDCLTRDGQAGMTAAFKTISGSAGAPSVTFTADPTSGLYLYAVGDLGVASNGVLSVILDASQVALFQQAVNAKAFVVLDTANASTSSNVNTLATAGTGAIAVGTGSSWATAGYVLCGNEIMAYATGTTAAIDVVARGVMGTTSITHATGATVTPLLSGMGKTEILLPARATASRPAFPGAGNIGFNSGSLQPEYYNGSGWVSLAPPQLTPQGYLSTVAGTSVITSDTASVAGIYYNPFNGNNIPVPTNGLITQTTFATASISLANSMTTAGIFDVYAFICTTNSTLTFGFGPSWGAGTSGSITPGSCARGTGAGGAALTQLYGIYTNAVAMSSVINGANAYTVASNSGLYLGSVYVGATAGTVTCHRSYGQNRMWGVWNAYNRVPLYLKAGDGTASWTHSTSTVLPSNNSTANNLTIFSGLAEEVYDLEFVQLANNASGNVAQSHTGIGFNSTATASGMQGSTIGISSVQSVSTMYAKYLAVPSLGVNVITSLDQGSGFGTLTWYGTETNMLLSARWRG